MNSHISHCLRSVKNPSLESGSRTPQYLTAWRINYCGKSSVSD